MDRLLSRRILLLLDNNCLRGATTRIDERLSRILTRFHDDRTHFIEEDLLGQPWRLTLVHRKQAHPFALPYRVALIAEPHENSVGAADTLAREFGLTPAEQRCAMALPDAGSVPELAKRFGVGTETIRTQLRSIFAKTGVGSQAELVLLLARRGFIEDR